MFCLNVLGKSVSVCMSVCLGPGAEWPLEELGEGAGTVGRCLGVHGSSVTTSGSASKLHGQTHSEREVQPLLYILGIVTSQIVVMGIK